MDASPELLVNEAFGERADAALLLADAPDLPYDWVGDPSKLPAPVEKTALLSFSPSGVQFREWLPARLARAWRSPNGAVYCTGSHGQVMLLTPGGYRVEQVVDADDAMLSFVMGFGGKTENEDIVLAFSGLRAFLRVGGKWSEIAVPEDAEKLISADGRTANEVYWVTAGGVFLWDGREVTPVEGPNDELRGVLVRPNGDMLMTGMNALHVWSEGAQKWTRQKAPVRLRAGMAEQNGVVFLATGEGVLRWDGKTFEMDAQGFDTIGFSTVGTQLFVMGGDEGLRMRRSNEWVPVAVPMSLLPPEPR